MKRGYLTLPLLLICLLIASPVRAQEENIPEDFDGLLVKADITVTMRGGDLEISITLMDESILQYATKEMRDHLNMLIEEYLTDNTSYRADDPNRPIPFLVNFRALGQEVRYEPYELVIYNYSQEYKPVEIVSISPRFFDRVAYIRQKPVAAIYLFDHRIDLNSRDLTISYFDALIFNNWLRVIEAVNRSKAQLEIFRARKKEK
ncbi:MAG: hypothetical protein JXQ83_03015 [Candidatus Glassbacteria bacterium]|nr:hypothetical protein [Candidatus Glassbacteria bacterium]